MRVTIAVLSLLALVAGPAAARAAEEPVERTPRVASSRPGTVVIADSNSLSFRRSSKDDVSFKSVTAKPAPEMSSTADRSVDMDANYAYMRNTNYRALWDDLQRMIYIDNPSRLSPYPIVDMSGNPR